MPKEIIKEATNKNLKFYEKKNYDDSFDNKMNINDYSSLNPMMPMNPMNINFNLNSKFSNINLINNNINNKFFSGGNGNIEFNQMDTNF